MGVEMVRWAGAPGIPPWGPYYSRFRGYMRQRKINYSGGMTMFKGDIEVKTISFELKDDINMVFPPSLVPVEVKTVKEIRELYRKG